METIILQLRADQSICSMSGSRDVSHVSACLRPAEIDAVPHSALVSVSSGLLDDIQVTFHG